MTHAFIVDYRKRSTTPGKKCGDPRDRGGGSPDAGRRGPSLHSRAVQLAGDGGGVGLGGGRRALPSHPPASGQHVRCHRSLLGPFGARDSPPGPHPTAAHHGNSVEDAADLRGARLGRQVRGAPGLRGPAARSGDLGGPAHEGRRVPRRPRSDEGVRVPGPHPALGRQAPTPKELEAPPHDRHARPPQSELRYLPGSPGRATGLPSSYAIQHARPQDRSRPPGGPGHPHRWIPPLRGGPAAVHRRCTGRSPGPAKRLLRFRAPMRSRVATVEKVDLRYFSTRSKQGV